MTYADVAASTPSKTTPARGSGRTRGTNVNDDAIDRALVLAARIRGFLTTYDARDKCASMAQYCALFVSNGEAGRALNASKSLAMARKPFRALKELDALAPAVERKFGSKTRARARMSAIEEGAFYGKALGMFAYFAFDHVVWATSAGIVGSTRDAALQEKAQRASYWGWFFGSACGLFLDTNSLNALLDEMKASGFGERGEEEEEEEEEEDAETRRRRDALRSRARKVFAGLITNSAQAMLALAMLDKVKMSKRNIGALGMFLSAVNIATMLPPAENAPKAKTA